MTPNSAERGSRMLRTFVRVGALGLGVGVGLVLAAPLISSDPEQRKRMLKGFVRSCADLQESLQARLAEAQERLSDVWAEVQAERAAAPSAQRTAAVRASERRAREAAPRAHAAR
jgi:hypothetical protein